MINFKKFLLLSLLIILSSCGTLSDVGKTMRNEKIISNDEFLVKMKLEVIVEDDDAVKVSDAIKKAAYSGKIGDGKIFIYNIDQVIRIRTGEKDSDAV